MSSTDKLDAVAEEHSVISSISNAEVFEGNVSFRETSQRGGTRFSAGDVNAGLEENEMLVKSDKGDPGQAEKERFLLTAKVLFSFYFDVAWFPV